MDPLTLVIVETGLLSGAFVLGGIFGAGVYHFAKKQVESGAKAVAQAADKGASAIGKAASKL